MRKKRYLKYVQLIWFFYLFLISLAIKNPGITKFWHIFIQLFFSIYAHCLLLSFLFFSLIFSLILPSFSLSIIFLPFYLNFIFFSSALLFHTLFYTVTFFSTSLRHFPSNRDSVNITTNKPHTSPTTVRFCGEDYLLSCTGVISLSIQTNGINRN